MLALGVMTCDTTVTLKHLTNGSNIMSPQSQKQTLKSLNSATLNY